MTKFWKAPDKHPLKTPIGKFILTKLLSKLNAELCQGCTPLDLAALDLAALGPSRFVMAMVTGTL